MFQLSALFLFYAAFPWSSESGEAGCDGEESWGEGRGERQQGGKCKNVREARSLRDFQKAKKKKKKNFYYDIAINNHSVLVKIIIAEGNRNWTNSGLSGSGFIFLKQET